MSSIGGTPATERLTGCVASRSSTSPKAAMVGTLSTVGASLVHLPIREARLAPRIAAVPA